jgi:hypothetical protein
MRVVAGTALYRRSDRKVSNPSQPYFKLSTVKTCRYTYIVTEAFI